MLALKLGVEVLEPFVMIFDNDFVSNSKEIQDSGIRAGAYFATLYQHDKYNLSEYLNDASTISNLESVNAFIIFDIFVNNRDRHDRNTMLIPNAKAIGSHYKYVLIDHGRCFRITEGDLPYEQPKIEWNTSCVDTYKLHEKINFVMGMATLNLLECIFTEIDKHVKRPAHVDMLQNALITRDPGDIMSIIDKYYGHLLGGQ